MADYWHAGQLVEIDATWPSDPSVVHLTYTEQPIGGDEGSPVDITSSVSAPASTGKFHANFDTTGLPACLIRYRWYSTGAEQAAQRGSFFVLA